MDSNDYKSAKKIFTEAFVTKALSMDNPPITIGRARELLGFEKMEDMRKWMDENIKNEATK